MKLTNKDIAMIRGLHESATGKWLVDFLERKKVDMFSPGTVTRENVDAKNEAIKVIDSLIEDIQFSEQMGAPQPGEFE